MAEKKRKASPSRKKSRNPGLRENTQVREKFGRVATRMGFVTREQVTKALEIQRKQDATGQSHKLIGLIMLEEGMLSNSQLIEILKYFELKREKENS